MRVLVEIVFDGVDPNGDEADMILDGVLGTHGIKQLTELLGADEFVVIDAVGDE